MKAFFVPVEGESKIVELSKDDDERFKQLQKYVGGQFEKMDKFYKHKNLKKFDVLFNEEGKIKKLKPNNSMDNFCHMDIDGNAIIVKHNDGGDIVSLTDKDIELIKSLNIPF